MEEMGLSVIERTVSVPFFYPRQLNPSRIAAKLVGASLVLVVENPATDG